MNTEVTSPLNVEAALRRLLATLAVDASTVVRGNVSALATKAKARLREIGVAVPANASANALANLNSNSLQPKVLLHLAKTVAPGMVATKVARNATEMKLVKTAVTTATKADLTNLLSTLGISVPATASLNALHAAALEALARRYDLGAIEKAALRKVPLSKLPHDIPRVVLGDMLRKNQLQQRALKNADAGTLYATLTRKRPGLGGVGGNLTSVAQLNQLHSAWKRQRAVERVVGPMFARAIAQNNLRQRQQPANNLQQPATTSNMDLSRNRLKRTLSTGELRPTPARANRPTNMNTGNRPTNIRGAYVIDDDNVARLRSNLRTTRQAGSRELTGAVSKAQVLVARAARNRANSNYNSAKAKEEQAMQILRDASTRYGFNVSGLMKNREIRELQKLLANMSRGQAVNPANSEATLRGKIMNMFSQRPPDNATANDLRRAYEKTKGKKARVR